MKIDGKKISSEIIDNLKKQEAPKGILAAILVGDNEASKSFLNIKKKVADELGVDFRVYEFDKDISTNNLRDEVVRISKQGSVRGVIVQLPLPESINRDRVLKAVPKEKDIDDLNSGKFLSPAVLTLLEILDREDVNLKNVSCAVVGHGFLIGKPIASYLSDRVNKLTIFEEGSDLSDLKNYDVVVLGVGKAGVVDSSNLKEDSLVIDFGYDKGKGDLNVDSYTVKYTPTPGGAGPILVAKLFENFFKNI